jgi:predicted CXXCH cytochrome family protein
LDVVINPPVTFQGGTFGESMDRCEGCHGGGNPAGGLDWQGVFLDTDLRQQHPISVVYDPAFDPGFRSVAEVEAAGLELFDGRVQCMTCHEPHSQQFYPFLRMSASGGALCLACHISSPAETTAHHW